MTLRRLVSETLAVTNEADPSRVAALVLEQVEDYEAALHETIRSFVREVMRSHRSENRTPAPAQKRSTKADRIREAWRTRLRDRVHVGGAQWKLLGECTYDDLMALADERQSIAEKNLSMAAEYRKLADAVKLAGVETLGDLP